MPTISNVKPVYPGGVLPWTDKIDNSDIDFANNVNTLAAEVESIETSVGTNPEIEPSPPTGLPVNYTSLSARVSDAMSGAKLPYCTLLATNVQVNNISSGIRVLFNPSLDPFNCYNGNDITIPVNGWWIISTIVQWSWWNNGYSHVFLTLNGANGILHDEVLNWEFPGNIQPLSYTAEGFPIIGTLPGGTPRWQKYGNRSIKTGITFNGPLHKGDVISVYLENGTTNPFQTCTNINLHAAMLRTIPPTTTFTSG